ncbi:MAG: polyribonucleotide nucleotidyltransferase, partial [Planctomycetes bacterium]|nr:polyribonucleotide nucleotidyltransferase [Planctomycetota bacterium]
MNNEQVFSTQWLGRTLTIKTGKLARQADSAVTVQYGDTVVFAAVVEEREPREGIDFFPLMVDFEERFYAAGMIKGSRWLKREGRPSDEAILTGRMIDRAIRPLFDQNARRDVQVTMTVLSADQKNDHDIVALIAASAALAITKLDWCGPIGGIRVGRLNGQFVFNPTYEERAQSDLDLIVAGTAEKTIMIEASANEVKEDDMLAAIRAGQKEIQPAIDLINEAKKKVAAKDRYLPKPKANQPADEEKQKVLALAEKWLKNNIDKYLFDKIYYTKGERKAAVAAIKESLNEYLDEAGVAENSYHWTVVELAEKMIEAAVTNAIIKEKRRVDGRALDEIRPLSADAGILPRNHGSGLFQRGETQILSIVTLAGPGMAQALEGIEGVGEKRYMHHYNFPPFATAEAKPLRNPGRREIGHGALAEKALIPVLPNKEEFPYTIRVVSETMSSNGSSSMGSTCGSTLALMDAGVPIKKAVAGIAMGLASNEDMSRWEVLTDIQDLEDGPGGMDFKITGTADGITAIQLDTKTDGLTDEIVEKTLTQGKKARLEILGVMSQAIDKPRPDLSPYAPRIISFMINKDKIRDVIGPGGKVINGIIEATGVTIDIEDDGSVFVSGVDAAKAQEAVDWIKDLIRDFTVGEVFTGQVVRILDFGAFVELAPGRDGMVHVSKLAPYHVGKPSDFLSVGDTIQVKIEEIDEQNRINLTMLGLPENEHLWREEKGKSDGFGAPRFGGGDRGGSR